MSITESKIGGKAAFFVYDDSDAPECNCGEPAVFKIAVSKANNPYGRFVCAKSAGEDWQDKCDWEGQWLNEVKEGGR